MGSIEAEAQTRGLSVNALVNSILSKYANWERFADQFRFIPLTDDLLRAALNQLSDEDVAHITKTLGGHVVNEGMAFWKKETDLDGLVTYLANRCRYAGYGNLAYETKGKNHRLVIEHNLGHKWSIYLKHTLDDTFRKKLGVVAQFELSNSEITVRFKESQIVRGLEQSG